MYIVLTEDQNDFEAIKIILKRLENDQHLQVKGRGFSGSGQLFNLGAITFNSIIKATNARNPKCVVVHDCDKDESEHKHQRVAKDILTKIKTEAILCSIIPKQEIEAWILADIASVTKVFNGWIPKKSYPQPENIDDPKEELKKQSRTQNLKPRYTESDAAKLAAVLDLETVRRKCPSFQILHNLVKTQQGNHPPK
ncbi:DUF4276 family protein [Burkholderia cenocepacia]|uniref:DUF4276 family protein n=1 Tax=Burkholderia cenocepacia TaxID=95486 RepID=UPI00285D55A1|nr:DUF4276 family protein [Burkholderia cenocepacia]MDR5647139.1 DUF4276 family protein [Burkholderia cenocepacia]